MSTIGELAKRLNINVETIRYYERMGLIAQPEKPLSGFRQYSKLHEDRLRFIINAKSLGFTLAEIENLLLMSNNCGDVRSLGLKKLELIRSKIRSLKALEDVIVELTDHCQMKDGMQACPIIDALKN